MTARIHCPLCDWSHEDYGPNPQATDPRALAAVFGHGVFAAHAIASHARKIEETLAAHFKTHTTVEWLRKVTELSALLREAEPWVSNCDEVPSEIVSRIDAALSADKPRFTDGRGNSLDHLVDEPPK